MKSIHTLGSCDYHVMSQKHMI